MNKLVNTAVTATLAGGLVLGVTTQSHAATPVRLKALSTAAAKKNSPYLLGAEGPKKFDCSGLVWYSYKKNGKTLPRTAQGQYNKATKIAASKRAKGDLVFFGTSGSKIKHVGIYAGGGKIWNANTGAYRGEKVVLAPISEYPSNTNHWKVYYGRYTG
jgi:cell wall-associated NlpC family hydrolase